MSLATFFIGLFVGGSIIFSIFSFFRNFYLLPYRRTYPSPGGAGGAPPQTKSQMGFWLLFLLGLLLFYLLSERKDFSFLHRGLTTDTRKNELVRIDSKLGNTDLKSWVEPAQNRGELLGELERQIDQRKKVLDNYHPEEGSEIIYPESPRLQNVYGIQVSAGEIDRFIWDNTAKFSKRFPKKTVFIYNDPESKLKKIIIGTFHSAEAAKGFRDKYQRILGEECFTVDMSTLIKSRFMAAPASW